MPHTHWEDFSFDGIGTRWDVSTPVPLNPSVRMGLLALVERYERGERVTGHAKYRVRI